MKVKMYRTAKYGNVSEVEVEKITAMPGPEEITEDDIEYADGIMMTLWMPDGTTMFVPHSFIIEIC